MASQANVKDIAALEDFAASLAQQRDELSVVLEAVQIELDRLSSHLQKQSPDYWRKELQRAGERLTEARETLSRCEQVTRDDDRRPCDIERRAVQLAKRRVDECEQHLRDIRALAALWQREHSQVASQLRLLIDYNESGVAHACRDLQQTVATLRKYAEERS